MTIDTRLNVVPAETRERFVSPSLAARLWVAVRAYIRRRNTLNTLSDLDDRLLKDVGLRREDLTLLGRHRGWPPSTSANDLIEALRKRSE